MKTCWMITNGTAGTASQALGLAQAMGFREIKQKIFKTTFSFSLLPFLAHIFLEKFLSHDSDKLEGPWPDVIIGCGRRIIPVLLYIKRITAGKAYCIYVQDPKISAIYFDLIVKMKHDRITGDNVIATDFSLNLINKKKLSEEAKKYKKKFERFPRPFYTILIGGNTKRYEMRDEAVKDLIDKVSAIVRLCSGSVLITISRRTPHLLNATLLNRFCRNDTVYIISPDSKESNPYFAMLSMAEKIFVTNDSVNMISEACACEKPVYIVQLLGISLGKTGKFLQTLQDKNLVKIFDGTAIKEDSKVHFNNNQLVAAKVRNKLLNDKICTLSDFDNRVKEYTLLQ